MVKNDTRTGKSVINLATGVFSQAIILILNFVIRFLFVQKIGYEYLGINSLFTNILTVLSVADLGFGSALGIVLYSSLAKKDEKEIAGLMNFFKKVYLIIGIIVTVSGLIATPFVKYLVNTEQEIPYLSIYFLFFLANTVSSYFISYRTILIRADQKNSVVNNVTTIVKVAKAVLEALVLIICPSLFGLMVTYILYLSIMVVSTYAIGIITAVYAQKRYPYAFDNSIKVKDEKKKDIISTTKDLFIYRLCSALSSPIDSILISLFVGTALLGIYSNYLLIITTILEFICLISRNVISSVGNFVVERPIDDQKKLYFEMQMVYFAIIAFATINFVGLATPFIHLVFKEGSVLSEWVVFLLGGYLVTRCAGELAIIFRETTRIYEKTKYISLFCTFLHIGLSLLFGYFMGLEGILLGNVVSYFATNFWFEIYALFKWHFKTSSVKVFLQFGYVFLITVGFSAGNYYLCKLLINNGEITNFVLAAICSLSISIVAVLLLYPLEGFKSLINRIKKLSIAIYKKSKPFYNSKKAQIAVMATFAIAFTALILARDLFAVNIDKFVFFLVIIVATLLCNRANGLIVLLFVLPICPSLSELYVLSYFLLYIFLFSIKIHSIKKWLLIFSVPILIFALELILSAIYGSIQINLAFRILVLLSILAIIFYDRKLFQRKHAFALVAGCLYMCLIMAIDYIVPTIYGVLNKNPKFSWLSIPDILREVRFGFSVISWIKIQAGVDYPFVSKEVVLENPNNIGYLSIVCIAVLLALYGTTRGKEKIATIISLLLFIVFGIWSQSRTFILVFVLLFVTFMIFRLTAKRISAKKITIIFVLLAAIISLIAITNVELLQNFFRRFFDKDAASGGGRLYLIGDYFGFIFSDWKYALFGISCSNISSVSGFDIPPHANFVQFIVSYGLIAFVGIVTFIIISSIKTKKVKANTPYTYMIVPILFNVIFTLTLQLFLPSIILILFIPSIICLSFLNNDIDENKKIYYYPNSPVNISRDSTVKMAMCSESFGGGIGSYIANISQYLVDSKTVLTFIYNPDTTSNERSRFAEIKKDELLFTKRIHKLKIAHLVAKLRYYLKSFNSKNPDIIYINTSSYKRSLILLLAAFLHKTSHIVVHCHNAVNYKSDLSFGDKTIRLITRCWKYDRFACSLESGRVFFGNNFGTIAPENKTIMDEVISNFVDTDKFKFNLQKRKKIRDEFCISKNDILIGCVGRISPEKNQEFIIEVAKDLPPSYKVMIVGSGPLKEKLVSQIEYLGLNNKVIMVENRRDIDSFYSAFDLFCLPSFIEGLPFVSVEAQSSGLPNIISFGLPKSTNITGDVLFIPLDVETWKNIILLTKPNSSEKRFAYNDILKSSGFSLQKAPQFIVDRIERIAYEKNIICNWINP